jgi:hypothetical protein
MVVQDIAVANHIAVVVEVVQEQSVAATLKQITVVSVQYQL